MTWGDVTEMGAKVLVVTDDRPEAGLALAAELGRQLFELRHSTTMDLLNLEATLSRTFAILSGNPGKPVVISDTTDNPGGGAPGDATFILQALLEKGIDGVVLATLWDPIAVATASAAGEGAQLSLRIGGKMGPASGQPVDVQARVKKVVGEARQTFAGNPISLGAAAVIEVNGIEIILNSQRTQIFGVDCLTNLGIEPFEKRVIVVKSSQHFYASFAPLAAEVLYCATPGTLMMDIPAIPYQHIDRRKWPLIENPFLL
jgi:microcystin degradation protein MlrC